ncbi:aldo/keto reductase [Paracoccus pacificus]|uniref:Aldo/keto reductase n=1 Tax=Paracoccus pacificus TaxID=1463598 RepID=A0ABW4R390_9RHOB
MDQVELGRSGIRVSAVCLGTMTFGNQTGQKDAFAQMDRALDAGISFLDTAEMYPVNPVRKETVGNSERMIGAWLAARGNRAKVQIATKIAGPGNMQVRNGQGYDGGNVGTQIDVSLSRLGVDVIDLYQLHWPSRGSYAFRQNWGYDPSRIDPGKTLAEMADMIGALQKAVDAGKIRAFGLSNDSAWGTIRWIDTAARLGGPRVASVQNEYSLLNRHYDTDMAEMAIAEGVTLLSYSPLAAGLLTGKYQNGAVPPGSRVAVDIANGGAGHLGGRKTDRAFGAVAAYQDLANRLGWDLIHMANAWGLARPFPVIPIIGATSDDQLAHNLAGIEKRLSAEEVAEINLVHRAWPMPY